MAFAALSTEVSCINETVSAFSTVGTLIDCTVNTSHTNAFATIFNTFRTSDAFAAVITIIKFVFASFTFRTDVIRIVAVIADQTNSTKICFCPTNSTFRTVKSFITQTFNTFQITVFT